MIFYKHQGYHSVAALLDVVNENDYKRQFGLDHNIYATNWPLPFTANDRENMPRNLRMAVALGIATAVLAAMYVIPHIMVNITLPYFLYFFSNICENPLNHKKTTTNL